MHSFLLAEGISAFDGMTKLESVRLGYVHIADDGVARAYDENESVIDYLRNPMDRQALQHSPSGQGFTHVATDGVYRSFSSSGEEIDYKQLSPAEIAEMLEFFGEYLDPEAFEKGRKKFDGVDGRNVADLEQLLHPGPGIRPSRFRE
ncbi:hypothetical protein BDV09DRAFT_190544 [Aspergillus tetrazonus]